MRTRRDDAVFFDIPDLHRSFADAPQFSAGERGKMDDSLVAVVEIEILP